MLELDSRPCHLGIYLNTPTQKAGPTERVPAKVIAIHNILLDKEKLGELLGDPHAWDALYIENKGKPDEPIFAERLGVLAVLGKHKDSSVTVSFGLKPYEVSFNCATVKSMKLCRQSGGLTALSITVVCLKSNVAGDLARLDEYLDKPANVALKLGDPEDDEDGDDDGEELDLDHSRSASAIGTPEQEREKAHEREERIGQEQAAALARSKPANGKGATKRRGRKPSDGATVN